MILPLRILNMAGWELVGAFSTGAPFAGACAIARALPAGLVEADRLCWNATPS